MGNVLYINNLVKFTEINFNMKIPFSQIAFISHLAFIPQCLFITKHSLNT